MQKKRSSVDGFIPRQSGGRFGDVSKSGRQIGQVDERRELGRQSFDDEVVRRPIGIAREEIDESLRGIDELEENEAKKQQKNRSKSPLSSKKKIFKRLIVLILIIAVATFGYLGIKAFLASSNIFSGNLIGIFQSQPLKMDENGRSNILVFGTSGTVDDQSHPGANLTDSILVLSIDQTKKDAYMVSIPRDLYVEYGGVCPEGYQGKINSLYMCKSNDGEDDQAGADALKKKVGEVLGLDIQYSAHVNWEVLQDSVNAVGGVDVKIESEDPRGILDRNFDWKCNYDCYFVNYKQGEVAHLDGDHALALSRARNAAGGYGLPGGNFDREKNQQRIIKALLEKASGADTLTNVGKVTSLIDAMGKNLKTSFATEEIQTLMSLGREIKPNNIKNLTLVDESDPLVATDNIGGSSVVVPVAGTYDYSKIADFIHKQLNANEITKEAAQIVIFNGAQVPGLGGSEADKLEQKGFSILAVDNAPAGEYGDVEIYQIGEGMPATAAKLKQIFSVENIKKTNPPFPVNVEANFVIIFGSDRSQ